MFGFLRKPVAAGVPAAPAIRTSGKGPFRVKRNAALGAACISVVGSFEGLRTVAYPDPATRGKPWTVCYGETDGVKAGDRYTVAECKAMLASSLEKYALAVEGCVSAPMMFFAWLRDKGYVFDADGFTQPRADIRKAGHMKLRWYTVSQTKREWRTVVTKGGLEWLRQRWAVGPGKTLRLQMALAERQGRLAV